MFLKIENIKFWKIILEKVQVFNRIKKKNFQRKTLFFDKVIENLIIDKVDFMGTGTANIIFQNEV